MTAANKTKRGQVTLYHMFVGLFVVMFIFYGGLRYMSEFASISSTPLDNNTLMLESGVGRVFNDTNNVLTGVQNETLGIGGANAGSDPITLVTGASALFKTLKDGFTGFYNLISIAFTYLGVSPPTQQVAAIFGGMLFGMLMAITLAITGRFRDNT